MRRVVALAAAGITVLGIAFAGTAFADDGYDERDKIEECASGEARGEGTALVNTFRFDLCKTGDASTDVTGFFQAAGLPPSDLLVAPQGPITCAEFRGNSVGFVYPLTEGSQPAALAGITEILITATDGGPGGADSVVFTGPVPLGTFGTNCAPTVVGAPQPVTQGDVTVVNRSGA